MKKGKLASFRKTSLRYPAVELMDQPEAFPRKFLTIKLINLMKNLLTFSHTSSAHPHCSGTTVTINAEFRALYDYEAEDETELTIHEGEILFVETETDGWYYGYNKSGQRGNFPSNFVERV